MDLVVVAIILLFAAGAQDLLPVAGRLPVKGFPLTAAALYFARSKPTWIALTAHAWAALLTDALGGLPQGCTFTFLMMTLCGVRLLQRFTLAGSIFYGALLTMCLAPLQHLWMHGWMGGIAGVPVFSRSMLLLMAASMPVGLLTGADVFWGCGVMESFAGNRAVKKIEAPQWLTTNG